MNKPETRFFVVLLAVVSGVVLWLLLRPEPSGDSTRKKQRVPAGAKQPSKVSGAGTRETVPEFGTGEFKKHALERCRKWIASRNRDAASLVALWDITGDASLLDEAAAKFPNDPRVCVAMIRRVGITADALPWVERLMAAEPGNPAGWYWKAQIVAGTEKPEVALDALRAATGTKGKPDTHVRDRIATVREAALASGATVKEAAIMALSAPYSRGGFLPPWPGRLLHDEIEAAKAAGDTDRVAEIAGLGAAAGEHLGLIDAPTIGDDLVRMNVLKAMLRELDPETEYGTDGKTVTTRLAEVNAEWTETTKGWKPTDPADSFPNNLNRLTEAQASEFTDRFILHGERAAWRWLASLKTEP